MVAGQAQNPLGHGLRGGISNSSDAIHIGNRELSRLVRGVSYRWGGGVEPHTDANPACFRRRASIDRWLRELNGVGKQVPPIGDHEARNESGFGSDGCHLQFVSLKENQPGRDLQNTSQ